MFNRADLSQRLNLVGQRTVLVRQLFGGLVIDQRFIELLLSLSPSSL